MKKNSMLKKAPVGKSGPMKDSKAIPAAKLTGLHKAGSTVPLFNASRIDKMEGMNPKSTGGVKP